MISKKAVSKIDEKKYISSTEAIDAFYNLIYPSKRSSSNYKDMFYILVAISIIANQEDISYGR